MKAFMTALDIVYDEKETRGFFKINGIALLFTVGGILAALISLALIAVIPAILQFLGIPESIRDVVNFGRWPLLALMVMLWLAVLYRYAPDRREPGWRWVSWGSAIATLLWIGASLLFSFYVSNFGSYNKTYGSMGAIIILLLWFFLTAYAVLIGAELDAAIEHHAGAETARSGSRSAKARSARSTGKAEGKTRKKSD
jgi:membrane protein